MNSGFIETREYQRFHEFCDACRKYKYIGVCYGIPGVGKTLSARHYANWDNVQSYDKYQAAERGNVTLNDVVKSNAVFHTVPVINSANGISADISGLRQRLYQFLADDLDREKEIQLAEVRKNDLSEQQEELRRGRRLNLDYRPTEKAEKALEEVHLGFRDKYDTIRDPTELIMVDEADRPKMAGLEQLRAIFDRGGIGMVLIGMPGLEKRLARYPQLYSRVGFVHEFKPLSQTEIRQLLRDHWTPPPELYLPHDALDDEQAIATIIRIAHGNFRTLDRLLAQIWRVLKINRLNKVTPEAVEAARESMVIGTA
jgi:DNA transposition AAA+ family ATPase